MPRIHFLFCSGVCILNAAAIIAQSLPKKPTPQQVIGYQLRQQKIWNVQQLPKNSVLYKLDQRYAAWQSRQFSFKKEKTQTFSFSSPGLFHIQPPASLPALRANLLQQKHLYNQWRKQSWWKDPAKAQGSLWLRDFLINPKNGSNYHL